MSTQISQSDRTVTGHSATVEMWLHLGTKRVPMLQSMGTEIMVDDPGSIPLGDAVTEVIVDGRSHRRAVRVVGPGSWKDWLAIEER